MSASPTASRSEPSTALSRLLARNKEWVAERTGAKLVVIYHSVGGAPKGSEVYLLLFDLNVANLFVDGGRPAAVIDVDSLGPGRREDDLATLLHTLERSHPEPFHGVSREEFSGLTIFDSLDEVGKQQFRAHLEDIRAERFNTEDVEVQSDPLVVAAAAREADHSTTCARNAST